MRVRHISTSCILRLLTQKMCDIFHSRSRNFVSTVKGDADICCRVITFFLLKRYVTLQPWPLDFWPWPMIIPGRSRDPSSEVRRFYVPCSRAMSYEVLHSMSLTLCLQQLRMRHITVASFASPSFPSPPIDSSLEGGRLGMTILLVLRWLGGRCLRFIVGTRLQFEMFNIQQNPSQISQYPISQYPRYPNVQSIYTRRTKL